MAFSEDLVIFARRPPRCVHCVTASSQGTGDGSLQKQTLRTGTVVQQYMQLVYR